MHLPKIQFNRNHLSVFKNLQLGINRKHHGTRQHIMSPQNFIRNIQFPISSEPHQDPIKALKDSILT